MLEQDELKTPPGNQRDIKCAIHKCDNEEYNLTGVPKDERCRRLGAMKHACVAKKVKGKEPQIYSETFVNMNSFPPSILLSSAGSGVKNIFHAMHKIGATVSTYIIGGLRRPDLMYLDKNGQRRVADAKFPCPDKISPGKAVRPSPSSSASMLTGAQRDAYREIQNNGNDPEEIQPSDCKASDCDD